MAAADLLLLTALFAAASALGLFGAPVAGLGASMAVAAAANAACLWAGGLYPGYRLHHHEILRRRMLWGAATVLASAGAAALLTHDATAATTVGAVALAAAAAQAALLAPLRAALRGAGLWGEPAIVYASPELAPALCALLQRRWELGVDPVVARSRFAPFAPGMAARGRRAPLALIAGDALPDRATLAAMRRAHGLVVLLADLPELGVSSIQPRDVNGRIGLELTDRRDGRAERLFRRACDIAIAGGALLALAPIMIFAAAAVWISDPGPVIYRQTRRGLNGGLVSVLKFRTMYRDAEERLQVLLREDPAARAEWETHFKLRDDPRILPGVGSLLRSSSIDELPQLFNVLGGSMSAVGPRPLPDYHMSALRPEFREKRGEVTPGLTGLWQVTSRSDSDLDLLQQLDSFYIDNRSSALDLSILARTFSAVLRRSGAY
jgi:lipopolysaccharide/colanic/teichoic acid biosynthesis glycosyltransferase